MDDRLIRLPEVSSITGCGRTKIYELERAGKFPKRIPLGATTTWSEREVRAWVQERIAERDQGEAERKQAGERLREARSTPEARARIAAKRAARAAARREQEQKAQA